MVLNVLKNDEKGLEGKIIFEEGKEDSEIQRIKKHLDITHIKYVSDNIKNLLNLSITNDDSCFKINNNNFRVMGQGDKYRVILYIRLSIEDGDVIDGDVSKSIKNQLLILLDECEKRDWIVVGIFCEDGISGANDNRPEWKKSLKFCENGNTEIILCKSQSRFSRSMEMIEKYLHNEFVNWNVRFVGLVDSTDTSIIGNKKTRQINGLVNEWQVEDQSINIRAVFKNKQSNGLYVGAFAPYGYKKDPKDKYHLIVDDEAANIVRKIFSMYASGIGPKKICDYLNNAKIPIPAIYKYQKGSKYHSTRFQQNERILYQVEKDEGLLEIAVKFQSTVESIMKCNGLKDDNIKEGQVITIPVIHIWRFNTIYTILKNEFYIGSLVQHKREGISYKNKKQRLIPKDQQIIVPHCHEAIINKETWKIVQDRFGKTNRVKQKSNGEIDLFSGKLYCGCCRHTLYRDSKVVGKKRYTYWSCGKRYSGCKALCNNKKSIRDAEIYELIIDEINKQIANYYDKKLVEENYYKQKIENSLEDEKKCLLTEKDNILKNINKKQNTLSLLYEDRVNGIIDTNEFTILKNRNNNDVENLKLRLLKIDKQIKELEIMSNEKKDTENILKKYNKIDELTRNIVDEFINRIEVGLYDKENQTRKIFIQWNINAS